MAQGCQAAGLGGAQLRILAPLGMRDVRQQQWESMATAVLMERDQPLHPFPLQLLLAAVAAIVN